MRFWSRNERAQAPVEATLTLDVGVPIIALNHVSRRFGDVSVLRSVEFHLQAGEYVAVCGASGSGKSTMLNLLGLLDRPDEGSVLVGGVEVDRLSDADRSSLRSTTIGFVFQAFHLVEWKTVLENVELAMTYRGIGPAERRDRATAAVLAVGLQHRLHARPATLSGGERQRVAIARALAARVRLLLADEPTGNLDEATGEEVLDLFDELHEDGLALIVVTHSEAVARRADRVTVMRNGVLDDLREAW